MTGVKGRSGRPRKNQPPNAATAEKPADSQPTDNRADEEIGLAPQPSPPNEAGEQPPAPQPSPRYRCGNCHGTISFGTGRCVTCLEQLDWSGIAKQSSGTA
jgi:hypothetical protein